jgi:hypothetical protein
LLLQSWKGINRQVVIKFWQKLFKQEILRSKIHKLIHSVWNKEKLPDQWKESIIVPFYKKGDKTDCSNYCEISLLSASYKILSSILSRLSQYMDEIIGILRVGFNITDQLLIRSFAFIRC